MKRLLSIVLIGLFLTQNVVEAKHHTSKKSCNSCETCSTCKKSTKKCSCGKKNNNHKKKFGCCN